MIMRKWEKETGRKLEEKSVLEASMWYVEEILYLRKTLLEIGRDE